MKRGKLLKVRKRLCVERETVDSVDNFYVRRGSLSKVKKHIVCGEGYCR